VLKPMLQRLIAQQPSVEATLLKLMMQRLKALYFRSYQDGTGIYLWPPEHMGMVQVLTFGHQNTLS